MITRQLVFALILAVLTTVPALAASPERGRLLYDNFCHHCHMHEIHFRIDSKIGSWEKLRRMVNMWQKEMGLGWSAEDVEDVGSWLDWAFYHLDDAPGPR